MAGLMLVWECMRLFVGPKARVEQSKYQYAQRKKALLNLIQQHPQRARNFAILCSTAGQGRITEAHH